MLKYVREHATPNPLLLLNKHIPLPHPLITPNNEQIKIMPQKLKKSLDFLAWTQQWSNNKQRRCRNNAYSIHVIIAQALGRELRQGGKDQRFQEQADGKSCT